MNGLTSSGDKFGFGKKWFWIGIIVSFFHFAAGLIYGLALIFEKDRRKEGLIIMVFAVIWFLLNFFIIGPWLVKSGFLPKFQLIIK